VSGPTQSRLLVTGAAGFIGYEVVRRAQSAGFAVTALDGLLGGLYPAKEKDQRFNSLASMPGITMMGEDLRVFDWEASGLSFDYVVNLAAMPGLALSWSDFDLYRSCNFDSVARLVEAARSWPLKKFIQISTSSVYGLDAVGDETMPLNPVSPYGVTKLAAENLLLAYFRTHNFPQSPFFAIFLSTVQARGQIWHIESSFRKRWPDKTSLFSEMGHNQERILTLMTLPTRQWRLSLTQNRVRPTTFVVPKRQQFLTPFLSSSRKQKVPLQSSSNPGFPAIKTEQRETAQKRIEISVLLRLQGCGMACAKKSNTLLGDSLFV